MAEGSKGVVKSLIGWCVHEGSLIVPVWVSPDAVARLKLTVPKSASANGVQSIRQKDGASAIHSAEVSFGR